MKPWFLNRFHRVTFAGDDKYRADCSCGSHRAIRFRADDVRWWIDCYCLCSARDALAVVGLRFDDLLHETKPHRADSVSGGSWGGGTTAVDGPAPLPVNERAAGAQQRDAGAELRLLLREHREGRARRVPVDMPALPSQTPPLARGVYEDMALRWELRMGADMPEDRPLPYATTEPVRAGWCQHPAQASRAIHWLEDHGLIWSPEAMEPRGKPDGTRTFLPGAKPSRPLPDFAGDVEAAARVRRAIDVQQPAVEVADERLMRDAVAGGGAGGFAASAGGASPRVVGSEASPHRRDVVHGTNSPASGGRTR